MTYQPKVALLAPLNLTNTTVSVSMDPLSIFSDLFDGNVVDTTNRWNTSGTVPPSTTTQACVLNPGGTASATSALESQAGFSQTQWSLFGVQVQLEATTIATGSYRCWGMGNPPTIPGTSAAPNQDFVGFEVTTGGVLRAVVYAGGSVVFSQNLTVPVDGLVHAYALFNVLGTYLWIMDTPVALAFTSILPNVQTLPIRIASLNSGSVTGTPTMSVSSTLIQDQNRGSQSISDGLFPWRKAVVDQSGALKVGSGIPSILQSKSAVSSGSVASLTVTPPQDVSPGNTIILGIGVGNGTTPTVTDTLGNTYVLDSVVANGSAFNTCIYRASLILGGGPNVITVTNSGSTASIAVEFYEVVGLLSYVNAVTDTTATATGTSTAPATAAMSAVSAHAFVVAVVGVGTGAQTITPGSGWSNDSGQLNPTTPAGLFSMVSMSRSAGANGAITPAATIVSEPWSVTAVAYRQSFMSIEGQMRLTDGVTVARVSSIGQVGVQTPEDIGKTNVQYYASGAAAGTTTTETAITLTQASGSGATSNAVSFAIPAGKTFRMTSIIFATRGNVTATAQVTTFSVRVNTGGAVIVTTTPVILQGVSGSAATSNAFDRLAITGNDAIEIAGGASVQWGITANSVYVTNAPTWDVTVTGYLYTTPT